MKVEAEVFSIAPNRKSSTRICVFRVGVSVPELLPEEFDHPGRRGEEPPAFVDAVFVDVIADRQPAVIVERLVFADDDRDQVGRVRLRLAPVIVRQPSSWFSRTPINSPFESAKKGALTVAIISVVIFWLVTSWQGNHQCASSFSPCDQIWRGLFG